MCDYEPPVLTIGISVAAIDLFKMGDMGNLVGIESDRLGKSDWCRYRHDYRRV